MYGSSGRARRCPRKDGYDYATPGAYFVTVATHGRAALFGAVADGEMRLSPAGNMVNDALENIAKLYPGVGTDAWVVMPDHVHVIITLDGAGANQKSQTPTGLDSRDAVRAKTNGAALLTLPQVVGRWKSLTTNRYLAGMASESWPPFRRRLWIRSYHDRIIRDQAAFEAIRRYIHDNPRAWQQARGEHDAYVAWTEGCVGASSLDVVSPQAPANTQTP